MKEKGNSTSLFHLAITVPKFTFPNGSKTDVIVIYVTE